MTAHPAQPSGAAPADPSRVEGIALSGEELFVILRLLRTRAIPGFDTSWAYAADGTLTERGRDCVAPAISALVARGYLRVNPQTPKPEKTGDETGVVVSAPVVALVGVCARSAVTVRALSQAPGMLGEFFLHVWEGLGAYHTSTGDGVHTFVPLDGRAGVIQAGLALSGLPSGAAPAPTETWRPAAMAKDALERAAQAAARGDAAGAHAALAATPLEPAMRAGLARALLTHTHLSEITVATQGADGAVAERVAFCVVAPDGIWSFAADGPAATATVMRLLGPGGALGLRQWLDNALPR